jgi:hypothetical protein
MTPVIAMCLTVQLLIVNDANVPADVLSAAKHEAVDIFARAGIAIVWHDEAPDAPAAYRFAVKIVPNALSHLNAKPHVMGAALRDTHGAIGTIVYAFFGRIHDFARVKRVSGGTMLAHVIAHEVGHLLLPKGSHSERGLMRGTWDRAQVENAVRGELTFTPEEIRTIAKVRQ